MNSPSYRDLTEQMLTQAFGELKRVPFGHVPPDVMIAHSAKAQAIATIAVAQALLHVADVLGATRAPAAQHERTDQ